MNAVAQDFAQQDEHRTGLFDGFDDEPAQQDDGTRNLFSWHRMVWCFPCGRSPANAASLIVLNIKI
jgi:hypothetical protein